MKGFLNKTMVATARDIYPDDVEKINALFFEILSIIGKYIIARNNFSNQFVIFLVNLSVRILNRGY